MIIISELSDGMCEGDIVGTSYGALVGTNGT